MTARVFISYRRDDSRYQARMVYTAFTDVLARDNVFMDIDSIPPGADFVAILEGWVGQCEILLALIGTGWVGAADPRTGRRRLDNPHDFVRIEICERRSSAAFRWRRCCSMTRRCPIPTSCPTI